MAMDNPKMSQSLLWLTILLRLPNIVPDEYNMRCIDIKMHSSCSASLNGYTRFSVYLYSEVQQYKQYNSPVYIFSKNKHIPH